MQLLKSANKISFGFGNGTVAPEYAYTGYIIVTPINVTLRIYNMSNVCYESSHALTQKRYSQFLNELYGLGIKENPDPAYMPCGISPDCIIIQKGNKTILNGSEDYDIITSKGSLKDPFIPLLDDDMKSVYYDPSSTFTPTSLPDILP